MDKLKTILSIAGSDSGAGAGIQADMKSAAAFGVHCSTAITAITAQNTVGVIRVEVLCDAIVKAQIDAVLSDFNVVSIKLGMIPSVGIVDVIVDSIEKYKIQDIVLDPVMIATSGDMLVDDSVARYIIERLMPLCRVITPNIPESRFITGIDVRSVEDFSIVAEAFRLMNCRSVLLKAGHIESKELTDFLYDFQANSVEQFAYKKMDTPNTHGTGCSLSSAIAANLCRGLSLSDAVDVSERWLHQAIEQAHYKMGDGYGPINHLYNVVYKNI